MNSENRVVTVAWLAEEQRRYELTLQALSDVDEGRTYSQEQFEAMTAEREASWRAHDSR